MHLRTLLLAGCLGPSVLLPSAQGATLVQWNCNGSDLTIATAGTRQNSSLTIVGISGGTQAPGVGSTDPLGTAATNRALSTNSYPSASATSTNKKAGIEFGVDTTGYVGLSVTYDQYNAVTSSRHWTLQYSTDGENFSDITSYSNTTPTTFVNGLGAAVPSAAFNKPFVKFRIVSTLSPTTSTYVASNSGSTYATSGAVRFDMLTVTGTLNSAPQVLPTPATTVAFGPVVSDGQAFAVTINATDVDATDILSLVTDLPLPSGVQISGVTASTSSPATFTVTGTTTYALNGKDVEVPFRVKDLYGESTPSSFTLHVIPEPTSLYVVAGAVLSVLQRRRAIKADEAFI